MFALGGVMVFAATGGGPYGSAEPQILMYRTVHEEPRLDGLPDGLREVAAACLAKEPEQRPALPALMARVGPAGPYGDWLPAPVADRLRRLSAQLADPRSPDAHVPRPGAQAPAGVPFDQLPTRTTPDGPPPPPSPGATPAWPAHTATPPPPASPGPSRRRLLGALSVVGGLAGTGALGWALWPQGGDRASGENAGGRPVVSPEPSGRLPQEILDKGRITIGSDIAYAPMEFVRDGRPAGVDVEIANALGRALGVRVAFENTVFDSLLAGLAAGRFDLVMSALADTKDRQQGIADGTKTGSGVDLVDYFRAGLVLVVRKGDPEGIRKPADLAGRTVAVQRGSLARDYVDELGRKVAKGPRIREFESQAEVYDDVAKGRSSACLDDFPVAAHTAATLSGGGVLALVGEQIEPLLYGIAVAKNRAALRDAVRGALDRLIRSGEYAKILKNWYVEDGAVERAAVNGGR